MHFGGYFMMAAESPSTPAAFEGPDRGFACPQEPLDLHFMNAASRRQATRTVGFFLKRFRRTLLAGSGGLEAALLHFVNDPGDVPLVCNAGIGLLRSALLMPPDSQRALAAAASFALYLAEHGRDQRWRLTLSRPESFLFSNYQLPAGTRMVFDGDGESANILIGHDGVSRRVRASVFRGEWRADGAEALPRLRTADDSVLLLAQLPEGIEVLDGVVIYRADDETVERYSAAYDFLAKFAPAYLSWVQRVIRAIVPVQSVLGHTYSQSFEFLPGVVALSEKARAIELAVCLVREAAHQYCRMVNQSASLPEGSDPEMEKLVSDYHAFANIYLVYRECRSRGFEDPEFCLVREQFLRPRLVQLQEHLQQEDGLGPIARVLVQPLSARL